MITFELEKGKIVDNLKLFEEFLIATGDQSSTMTDDNKVYLAGESHNEAHIASVALHEGSATQADLIRVDITGKSDGSQKTSLTHVIFDNDALFGAAEVKQDTSDAITQIALWSLNLTPDGLPTSGTVSSMLVPAATVTGI